MHVSICIPTYNRADKLRVLLGSIARQTGHYLLIEVAISDNASTDDTSAVVDHYRSLGMTIVYDLAPENRGFDRNLLNAVEIASGEYCWIFGSDDILEPGTFAALEQVLGRHARPAGIIVGLQSYNADLSLKLPDSNQVMNLFTHETVLTGRDDILETLCTCLGFISTSIVRRELWMTAVRRSPVEPYLKGYIHLYAIASMLDATSQWVCVPQRLVSYRTGNDSFSATNEFARTKLDIVGYDLAFGDTLGRDGRVYRRIMSKVAVTCVRTHFMVAKMQGASSVYWRQAIPFSVSYYWRYPAFWLRALPVALVPQGALRGARSLYRRTIKPAGRHPVSVTSGADSR